MELDRGIQATFRDLSGSEEELVETASKEAPTWILQEAIESRPYAFVDRGRITPHDGVWGIFNFGEDYGGAFLRTLPRGTGGGVINAHRGAVEALVLELSDEGAP